MRFHCISTSVRRPGFDKAVRLFESTGNNKWKKRLSFPAIVDLTNGTISSVKPDDKVVPIPRGRAI